MRLLTLAGAHAGEVQEYPYLVAQAAIRSGSARVIDDAPSAPQVESKPRDVTVAPHNRRRRQQGS